MRNSYRFFDLRFVAFCSSLVSASLSLLVSIMMAQVEQSRILRLDRDVIGFHPQANAAAS